VVEGLEYFRDGHGKCGSGRQRPVEVEEVATLLPLEQRSHLRHEHLVDVVGDDLGPEVRTTELDREWQALHGKVRSPLSHVGFDLDREFASLFPYTASSFSRTPENLSLLTYAVAAFAQSSLRHQPRLLASRSASSNRESRIETAVFMYSI
jgi:hypothetical protein